MTLDELKLIYAVIFRPASLAEKLEATKILNREIKLKEMDPRKESNEP